MTVTRRNPGRLLHLTESVPEVTLRVVGRVSASRVRFDLGKERDPCHLAIGVAIVSGRGSSKARESIGGEIEEFGALCGVFGRFRVRRDS